MNNKDNIIIIVVILILLSTIVKNNIMRILVSFFLMTFISFCLTKDIYKSIGLSFFLSLIYYLTSPDIQEGFENEEINVNSLVKELTNLASKNEEVNKEVNQDVKNSDKEITEEDTNLLEQDDNAPSEGNKYMESAKAQRETFRLINTIKQLDETVNSLAPTLKQGADIIEKFKKLNLIPT